MTDHSPNIIIELIAIYPIVPSNATYPMISPIPFTINHSYMIANTIAYKIATSPLTKHNTPRCLLVNSHNGQTKVLTNVHAQQWSQSNHNKNKRLTNNDSTQSLLVISPFWYQSSFDVSCNRPIDHILTTQQILILVTLVTPIGKYIGLLDYLLCY